MKHSTFLKFVCLILCAASILTLAGSGFGLYAMVELDLYDKNVDQVISDQYQSNAEYFAQVVAQRYAGHTLGGLPENFLESEYPGWFDKTFDEGGFGYAILDEEGNVLKEQNPEITAFSHTAFSFPMEGNYMHMVHSEPVPQEAPEVDFGLSEGEYGIIDRVGDGADSVYTILISYENGSEGIGSDQPLGWLTREDDGTIHFVQAGSIAYNLSGDTLITHITFMDDDGFILYEVADNHPVAIANMTSGGCFIELLYGTEIDYPIGDPAWRPVYKAIFYGADPETPIETLGSSQPIGAARLDDNGYLEFTLYVESANLKNAVSICSMVLMDSDGSVLFAEADPQLRTSGTQVATSDGLNFSSHPDAIAVALPVETIPVETVPETVPEEAAEAAAVSEEAPADAAGASEEEAPKETAAPEAQAAVVETIPVETMPAETIPPETTAPTEAIPETTAPTEPDYKDMVVNGKSVQEYGIDTYEYFDNDTQQLMQAKVIHVPMPAYTVNIFLRPELDQDAYAFTLMGLLKEYSFLLLPGLLGSLLIFALTVVYLCVSAGHRRTGEIKAGGLNRIPLDLYTVLAGTAIVGLCALFMVTCTDLLPRNMQVGLVLAPLFAYGVCLIFVGYCFAILSQCKTPGGYWWRNSLCGRLLTGGVDSVGSFGHWTVKKCFPWLGRQICQLWNVFLLVLEGCFRLLRRVYRKIKALVHDFLRFVFYAIRRFFSILPLTWQWVLGGLVLIFLGMLVFANRHDGWGMLWLLLGLGLVLYVSHCFGILHEGTKRMNKGDLETKIDDKKMVGCFQEFSKDLNSLAEVVVVAAQKQLRSERMKTELITNVSHDIKTPLTSIINYVDLLQKPHSEEEGKEYLEVLDRQSQRLKKLIDDLMDMSKANTGNMNVEITRLDAVESVNQALGEFADKLDKAELTPVFRHNTDEAFIMADGKLVWRVMSNLLSNAVKYAMPGTRLYLDLMSLDGRVILSMKNISRDELNVDAEELMERFVRGDDSRNTEGSGLGLNIAKSLMELQKGHLQLLVDGDLFKVTLVFPTPE